MAFKLKDVNKLETTYEKTKLKIPSSVDGEYEYFTKGIVQDKKTVAITENGTHTITPDENYTSIAQVEISADILSPKPEEELTKELDMADGDMVIVPETEGEVISKVTITKPSNLTADNIRHGQKIGGVFGSLIPSPDWVSNGQKGVSWETAYFNKNIDWTALLREDTYSENHNSFLGLIENKDEVFGGLILGLDLTDLYADWYCLAYLQSDDKQGTLVIIYSTGTHNATVDWSYIGAVFTGSVEISAIEGWNNSTLPLNGGNISMFDRAGMDKSKYVAGDSIAFGEFISTPTDNLDVSANGIYDVTNKATVNVQIDSGALIEPLEVTANGTYTATDGKAYNPVTVNVPKGTTIPLEVTANGVYTASEDEPYGSVTVNVPQEITKTVITKELGTAVFTLPEGTGTEWFYHQAENMDDITSTQSYLLVDTTDLLGRVTAFPLAIVSNDGLESGHYNLIFESITSVTPSIVYAFVRTELDTTLDIPTLTLVHMQMGETDISEHISVLDTKLIRIGSEVKSNPPTVEANALLFNDDSSVVDNTLILDSNARVENNNLICD